MEKEEIGQLISYIFECEEYNHSAERKEANKIINKELGKIEKLVSKELYEELEPKITLSQWASENCGFIFGFRCGVRLMCRCVGDMR